MKRNTNFRRQVLLLMAWSLTLLLFCITVILVFRLIGDVFTVVVASPDSVKSTVPDVVSTESNSFSEKKKVLDAKSSPKTTSKLLSQKEEIIKELKLEIEQNKNLINKSDDNTKDTVSNAMTAIGTAVAVLVLVLSMGTFYVETKQHQLKNLFDEEKERANQHLLYQNLQTKLAKAKLQTVIWVAANSKSETTTILALEIGFYLELLMSHDYKIRFFAFERLLDFFSRIKIMTPALIEIRDFTQECRRYHQAIMNTRTFENCLPSEEYVLPGAWCEIFNSNEVAAYRKKSAN